MDALEEIHGIVTHHHRSSPIRNIGQHYITQRAWRALTSHYHRQDLTTMLTRHLERFAPIAQVAYQQHCILITDYHFTAPTGEQVLWYRPNEHGTVTISLPANIRLTMTLEHLFGKPLHEYTDDMAVRDGSLIPFIAKKRDTGHRLTISAWHELTSYHRHHSYPDYDDMAFYRFFFAEVLPLLGEAQHDWNNGKILRTDYEFNTNRRADGVLWYVPNERNGVTIMLPSDY